jgi:hypothetical protein
VIRTRSAVELASGADACQAIVLRQSRHPRPLPPDGPQPAKERPADEASSKEREHRTQDYAGRDDQPLRPDRNPAHSVMSVSHHLDHFALGVDRGPAPEIARSGTPRHSAMAKRFRRAVSRLGDNYREHGQLNTQPEH